MKRTTRIVAVVLCSLALASPAVAAEVYTDGYTLVEVRGAFSGTGERVSDIPLDTAGTTLAERNLADAQARLGATVQLGFDLGIAPLVIRLVGEGDVHSGSLLEEPTIEALDLPGTGTDSTTLRAANVTVALGNLAQVTAGYMPSNWGMGLVAHGGDTAWAVEGSMFNDARGGDVVRRLVLSTGPLTSMKLSGFIFAGDEAVRDAQLLEGDTATDVGAGVRFDFDLLAGGLYFVSRLSEAADGAETRANVWDLHLKSSLSIFDGLDLNLETEAAIITGTSELAPAVEFQERDIVQFGWAGRAALDFGGTFGVVADALYATGDQNLDDGQQNAFRADPNFEMGLMLFRHVHAAQTGRSPITAGDPELVGVPAEDLDRLPSRGAVTNTFSFFPKAWWAPVKGLTLYGGVLLARTDVPLVDPRNTRFAGGDPRNALNGAPGGHLGTEFDLGVRYAVDVWQIRLQAGLEAGLLMPGEALVDATGETMDPVHGGRLMAQISF